MRQKEGERRKQISYDEAMQLHARGQKLEIPERKFAVYDLVRKEMSAYEHVINVCRGYLKNARRADEEDRERTEYAVLLDVVEKARNSLIKIPD